MIYRVALCILVCASPNGIETGRTMLQELFSEPFSFRIGWIFDLFLFLCRCLWEMTVFSSVDYQLPISESNNAFTCGENNERDSILCVYERRQKSRASFRKDFWVLVCIALFTLRIYSLSLQEHIIIIRENSSWRRKARRGIVGEYTTTTALWLDKKTLR